MLWIYKYVHEAAVQIRQVITVQSTQIFAFTVNATCLAEKQRKPSFRDHLSKKSLKGGFKITICVMNMEICLPRENENN